MASSPSSHSQPSSFSLSSPAFAHNEPIPIIYTQYSSAEEEAPSPPLMWCGAPEGTKELALICDDPDAPRDHPYVHWVIYGIDPKLSGLPAGAKENSPGNFIEGANETGGLGYVGPKPPAGHGWHRYIFTLYALNAKLDESSGLTKERLLKKMDGKIIAKAVLIGTYRRD